MKCVCGYEHGFKQNENGELIFCYGEYGSFILSKIDIPYKVKGDFYEVLCNSSVWICPKCGTLKIQMWS